MLNLILTIGIAIYIISSGIGLFVRALILTDKQNARNIFKSVLGSLHEDFERADHIVSNLLLFFALLPIINTIFSVVFIYRIIARLWKLVKEFHNEQ